MSQDRKPAISVGLVMTILICVLVSIRIMDSGQPISFEEFLQDHRNVLFTIYFSVLFFCAWIIRGDNNKTFLLIWTLAHILYYFIYWKLGEIYKFESRNIYVLNWSATVAMIPIYYLCNNRHKIIFYICSLLVYLSVSPEWAKKKIETLQYTSFEIRLNRFIKIWLVYEFSFSLFMTTYAIMMGLGINDSIRRTMQENQNLDIFMFYFFGGDVVSVFLILIIGRGAIRDYFNPDTFIERLTATDKDKLIEEFRKRNK